MNRECDTIAAMATAPGAAGIAIVRVSGVDALAIADQIFRSTGPPPSARPAGTFVHGHVHTDHDIDEVILLIYRAPASYTREDIVEFQGHGGRTTAQRLLRTILTSGARLADPGEFTRRAFLSGRIDLLQAEAVMDLIQARSERAASAAVAQLEGVLSEAFNRLHTHLLAIAADLEARLDFEDGELPASSMAELRGQLANSRTELQQLAASWDEGHLLRDGALVVIAGKPNVGKSTLMNALLGKARVIVTDIPGTTRDSLEEELILNGFPLRIVDTAGIRDADCSIEQEGIRRARALMNVSDLNLLVIDGYAPLDDLDQALLTQAKPRKTLLVINKIDKGQLLFEKDFKDFQSVACALRTGTGLEALKTTIMEMLSLHPCASPSPSAVVSERHLAIIRQIAVRLEEAAKLLHEEHESFEIMASTEIREAIELLGQITGRRYHAELLDTIFARFCVGK